MRPPGYEPGELPTAPLRDINQSNKAFGNAFPYLRVQRYTLLWNKQNISKVFSNKVLADGFIAFLALIIW